VYLTIISWNFVASGMIFVASSLFQALGNTVPSLVSSAFRMLLVIAPALFLATLPDFRMTWVWVLSAATVWGGGGGGVLLLRREFARVFGAPAVPVPLTAAGA
jgi:Na+-driven multidrug efflux pump